MIYDGDCNFCRFWIARWRENTGRKVRYRRSQQVADRFPEIPPVEFARAVQLVEPDGSVRSGADAVFRAYDVSGRPPLLLRIARLLPGFRTVARVAYRFIADHRATFSFLTRLLWGRSFRRPTFFIARWVFLRVLGVVYLIAFLSLLVQIRGLIGHRGILPAGEYLTAVRENVTGSDRYRMFPTVFWLSASDAALVGTCVVGVVLSCAVIFNVLPGLAFALLWFLYLSFVTVGRIFLGYQWDALLLEAGFVAIFLAPPALRPDWRANPPSTRLTHLLLLWLLCRFMLQSGIVKLASGDATWRDLTALHYHYETQPLPMPLAWHAHQSPLWWHQASAVLMFAIELAAPFALLGPARIRRAGCGAMLGLQGAIAATGNYTFFNLLTAGLCVLALDDDAWPARWRKAVRVSPRPRPEKPAAGWPRWIVLPLAATNVIVTGMQFAGTLRLQITWPKPLVRLHEAVLPFRNFNPYGLFAVMTTKRPEILIEGSNDGAEWRPYEFKWKPGDVRRAPGIVAPHQPRLDWQMWFAALGSARENPWFFHFIIRLLEGSPEVLTLLRTNPFPEAPPRLIRAVYYDYQFTRRGDGSDPEAWWKRELIGLYCQPLTLARLAPDPPPSPTPSP